MARLTRKRRKELEDFYNLYSGVRLYVIVKIDEQNVIYKACGGLAVGTANLKEQTNG